MSASSKKKLRKEQNAAELTEKQLKEQKESKKLKVQTIAFVAVIALVLVIGLGSLAVTAFNNSGITEKTTAALTVGEHELSTAELSYFFMDGFNNFYSSWYSSYGSYASVYLQLMMGLDLTQPLNEQIYDEEAGTTYGDYFTEIAVDGAVAAYAVYDRAMAEGYVLNDADIESINLTMEDLETTATSNNYTSAEEYLKAMYGKGATLKSFRSYLELLTITNQYSSDIYNGFTYDGAALSTYSDEHFDDYSSFSYCTFDVDPDDHLMCTAKEDDEDHEHTDEELENAKTSAKGFADLLVEAAPADAAAMNEVIGAFAAYAEDSTVSCDEFDDLYTEITDEELAAWLSDDSRKAGDMTILTEEVTTTADDGTESSVLRYYTVVLFLDRNDNNMNLVNVRHILKSYEGGTTDSTTGVTVYSDAEKQAAMDYITELQTQWVANGATEESFADLAALNSTDSGSSSNGGLYEDVYPGQMVTTFNDWCFDEFRQVGDYGIVETEYGVHLMYFVGHTDTTFRNYLIENDLREADYNAWYDELMESAEYTVLDTSKLPVDTALGG